MVGGGRHPARRSVDGQGASLKAAAMTTWKPAACRVILRRMRKPEKKPEMRPRELKDGSGWYVLVNWGDRPSEQWGGFQSEAEAQQWIDQDSANWLRVRFEDRLLD